MTNKIFSAKAELFLRDKLCMCIEDLTEKILEDAPNEVDFFNDLIEFYLTINLPYSLSNNLSVIQRKSNVKVFNSKLTTFYTANKLIDNSKSVLIYNELACIIEKKRLSKKNF